MINYHQIPRGVPFLLVGSQVFGHFSVENTVKKLNVSSKSQGKFKSGGGAKANGICFRYNSEEGCTESASLSINAVNVIPVNTGRRTKKSSKKDCALKSGANRRQRHIGLHI